MAYIPIWKDTEYLYTGQSVTYRVELNGETIFNGKAFAAPGETVIKINMNRICENYLHNDDIEVLLNGTQTSEVCYTATGAFKVYINGSSIVDEEFLFVYNYNYDPNEVYPDDGYYILSSPITDATATNMIQLYTYFLGNNVSNRTDYSGYTRNVCGAEYALYYLNAKGGWDTFLIEGNSQRTDKIKRHQYNKTFNNQTIDYEKNTYISEIETSWKLNTGILDDDQAKKMCWHLLSSNKVYLHDLVNNVIKPVVITNTQNVYNTYKNSDKRPIQYEIDVTESQTKLRN